MIVTHSKDAHFQLQSCLLKPNAGLPRCFRRNYTKGAVDMKDLDLLGPADFSTALLVLTATPGCVTSPLTANYSMAIIFPQLSIMDPEPPPSVGKSLNLGKLSFMSLNV